MTRTQRSKPSRQTVATILLMILIFATTAFIWGNSLESREESELKSQKVLELVSALLEPILGEGRVTLPLVRKLAHVAEFGMLGVGLALLLVVRRRVNVQTVNNILFVSFLVAAMDESLQILSQRGSLVTDVWIDLAGAAGGIAVVLGFRGLFLFLRERRIDSRSRILREAGKRIS